MPSPIIITLTTDYGTNDHLIGSMKGVMLKIHPDIQIIDISNHVLACDILDGALTIGMAYKYFPPKTIHVVVVDPGVGTPRRPILVTGDHHYFVAPDNGVLSMVYDTQESFSVRHVTSEHYFMRPMSNTFHGRDLFAPVAAWLAKNQQAMSFGEEINDPVRFTLPKPRTADGKVKGVILKVDNFGNLVTNIPPDLIPQAFIPDGKFRMTVAGKEVPKIMLTYGDGGPGEPFGVLGSAGLLEISVNRGSAARVLGAARGAEVIVELL
ncbi:MAG TPA: SAM-dependent chlorinase/fluorinase [Candidatus Acidoferrales bacterium]|nr:SAM-dependent chlorinase/fluorinase [Candidatus Acidoferrales bacterium]